MKTVWATVAGLLCATSQCCFQPDSDYFWSCGVLGMKTLFC